MDAGIPDDPHKIDLRRFDSDSCDQWSISLVVKCQTVTLASRVRFSYAPHNDLLKLPTCYDMSSSNREDVK